MILALHLTIALVTGGLRAGEATALLADGACERDLWLKAPAPEPLRHDAWTWRVTIPCTKAA